MAGVQTLSCDLCDAVATSHVIKIFRPDIIIHCAALTDVDACERDPHRAWQVNVEAPQNIVRAIANQAIQLVYISTDMVFDGKRGNYIETDTPLPLNEYANTKLQGETVALLAPLALVFRTNIYGWNLVEKYSFAERILMGLMKNKPLKLFRDVYFTPIYVNDISWLIEQAIGQNLRGLFHAGGAESVSKLEYGFMVADCFNYPPSCIESVSIEDISLSALRPKNMVLDSSRLLTLLQPPFPLGIRDGLARFKCDRDNGYVETLRGDALESKNI
jgi:dTDP-4-dehydrorhamnose reductase